MKITKMLAKNWFSIHLLMVVFGLTLALSFDYLLDLTNDFFRVMITFFCMVFTVNGLIGMAVCLKDNFNACGSRNSKKSCSSGGEKPSKYLSWR